MTLTSPREPAGEAAIAPTFTSANFRPLRVMYRDLPSVSVKRKSVTTATREITMWWGIGFGGLFLYLIILFTLGLMTLRKGHWVMFIIGIFFPLLWLIGAVIPPTTAEAA
jgi:hypothetical protein